MGRVARKKRLSLTGKRNGCPVCQQPNVTGPLHTAQDIVACLKPFRNQRQEFFITLSLDAGGRLIRRRVISIGSLTGSIIHPREVFAGAIRDRAATVIVAHNHPSGVAEPSEADVKATAQLVAAGLLLGIALQDHFIIAKDGYFSFREEKLI